MTARARSTGDALSRVGPLAACGMLLVIQQRSSRRRSGEIESLRERLVRARDEAEEARRRADMLERVTETVRGLLESPAARDEVCRAATAIAGASAAVMYEPRPDATLSCTATSGFECEADAVVIDDTSNGAWEAFQRGRPAFIDTSGGRRAASLELWRAAGSPVSVLYQPLLRGGSTLGVLAVGWDYKIAHDGSHCSVVALLAHEAAAVIAHADLRDALSGEARTDPLTGLTNRRGWDAALARGVSDDGPVAVAMLDIDYFKRFNDSFGHLAGDRLLAETAAAWQALLRGDDLLARLGGEEFGLLLIDDQAEHALEVVDRLRRCLPDGCTCSAGVAVRRCGEAPEALLARADGALYAAKAAGRDQARLSDGPAASADDMAAPGRLTPRDFSPATLL